jgi:hypothetical protein
MKTSLHNDIIIQAKRLLEQALPPLPPPGADPTAMPPPPGGEAPPGQDNAANPPAGDAEEEADEEMIAGGQPPVVPGGTVEDRIKTVFDYGFAVAKKTVDPQVITNAFKSAIQANFDDDISAAWPLIDKLENTENVTMQDVAQRLRLFISGTLQEKRIYMKVSKQEIRNMVREALGAKKTTIKEIHLSPKQLQTIVKKTIKKVMQESALFDTYRSQVGQVRSGIEQQLLSTEVQDMAIDLFEKICQKVGIDSDHLTPDAEKYIRNELDEMVVSAQELGVKLMQVATITKTAQTGTPEKNSNED